jgi:hypothetical protein
MKDSHLTPFGEYLRFMLIVYIILWFISKPLFYAELFAPPYP